MLVNDTTWATIQATDSSTVQELILALNAGRNVGSCSALLMTLCYNENGDKTERVLSPQEIPMKLIAGHSHTKDRPFVRIVIPSTLTLEKQRIVPEFCGFADIKAHRKDVWATRWIALKEQFLMWFKTPRDKKIRGQLDLSDAYLEANVSNDNEGGPTNKRMATPYVLQVIKPDRAIQLRFENSHLLHGWLQALKQHCSLDTDNLHFDFIKEDIEQHELQRWSKCEERFQKYARISAVLDCPKAFNFFLSYLKRAHSEEGLLFWRAVKKFKSDQISDKHAVEIAQTIFDKFIAPASGSHCELQFSCHDRAVIVSALNARPIKRELFDLAAESIIRQLDQEKFTDFKKSSYFRAILLELAKSPSLDTSAPCLEDLSL